MQVTTSITLTVLHDGQFWIGIFEHADEGRYGACRVVFGAEPSDEEVFAFVLGEWARLPLSEPVACETHEMARNPKRRQRETAREARRAKPSTKAQLALAEQRDAMAQKSAEHRRELREEERRRRFEQRQQKAKRKRRGH